MTALPDLARGVLRRCHLLLLTCASMASAAVPAAAPVTLSFPDRPTLTDVPRVGLNLGSWSFYGADQIMANVLKNPGFEGLLERMIIQTRETAGRYIADDDLRMGTADHSWDGAEFEAVTGPATGLHGRVKESLRQGYSGYPEYVLDQPAAAIDTPQAVVLTRRSLPAKPPNWWVSDANAGRLRLTSAEPRPGSPGQSQLRMVMPTNADTEIFSFLDSSGAPAGRLLPVQGKWRLTLWLRAVRGQPSVRVSLMRGPARLVEQRFVPGPAWREYRVDFTGKERPQAGDNASLQFTIAASGAGSEVAVDDVYLGADTSSVFRPEVVGLLQRLRPGYLRDWQGQLGDTMANRLAVPGGRLSSRFRQGNDGEFHYGLEEFVDLCAHIGAMPWVIIPSTLTAAELPTLTAFMQRKQHQHHFRQWVLEYGNENWNPLFRPGTLNNADLHAARTLSLYQTLRKQLPDVPFQPLINAQSAWPERAKPELASAQETGAALAIAPYYFNSMRSGASSVQILNSLFPDDEASIIAGFRRMGAASPWLYEYNLHTDDGNAGYAERERATAGVAAGLSLASRALSFYDLGVTHHAVYTLSQIYGLVRGATADNSRRIPLWGITRDFAFPTMRPSGLALELMNRAVGGDQYHLACQPQASCGKLVALGFNEGGRYAVALSNKSANARTLSLTWPGARPPAQGYALGGDSLWSNNENPVADRPAAVQIVKHPLDVSGRQLTLQLPAYGFVVITEKAP